MRSEIKTNKEDFKVDLKKVRDVMTYAPETVAYFKVSKREVLREAKDSVITYYLTDSVFVNKRTVMVIV